MERKEAIRSACRLVWDMDKRMCSEYQEKALSGIPEDFSGRLLLRVGCVPADGPAHPARI
ncbi:MAG: hypothetical protein ACLSDS_08580 [Oscillospiraceae bacterium]